MSIEDPLQFFMNKIVLCKKAGGHSFTGKLVSIFRDELYFQTSNGSIIMDRRNMINSMKLINLQQQREIYNYLYRKT